MRRTIARVDANQADIVQGLRRCGVSVAHTHMIGQGFPDLVCGWHGDNYMLEVKDGSKAASARKLTPDEEKFKSEWRGRIFVVESLDDALYVIGVVRK